MFGEEPKELDSDEWEKMLERDKRQTSDGGAMNSKVGLDEESKSNLTFMAIVMITLIITGFFGGWYYVSQ